MKIPSPKSLFRIISLISLIAAITIWMIYDRGVETIVSLFIGIASFAASLWTSDTPISEQILKAQYIHYRKRLIQKVENLWITSVLGKATKNHIELCLEYFTVKNEFRDGIQEKNHHHASKFFNSSEINTIFDKSEECLLILGEAGSGKTVCLLSLAKLLLKKASDDIDEPIPIVLNLSSWASERKPIEHWVVNELENLYGIPKSTGLEWVQHNLLILLLDGLNEIKANYSYEFIAEFNKFRERNRLTGVVVTGCLGQYKTMKNQLKLPSIATIQPLEDKQFNSYLASLDSDGEKIIAALNAEPFLKNLARTPLGLNMLYVSFKKLNENHSLSSDTEKQNKIILKQFIHQNLSECANNQGEEKKINKNAFLVC